MWGFKNRDFFDPIAPSPWNPGGGRHHDSDDADAHEATQGGTRSKRLSLGPPFLYRDFQGGLLRIPNPLWVFLRFLVFFFSLDVF
jgi:hypothetical protein